MSTPTNSVLCMAADQHLLCNSQRLLLTTAALKAPDRNLRLHLCQEHYDRLTALTFLFFHLTGKCFSTKQAFQIRQPTVSQDFTVFILLVYWPKLAPRTLYVSDDDESRRPVDGLSSSTSSRMSHRICCKACGGSAASAVANGRSASAATARTSSLWSCTQSQAHLSPTPVTRQWILLD